jgi:hypothetical protein
MPSLTDGSFPGGFVWAQPNMAFGRQIPAISRHEPDRMGPQGGQVVQNENSGLDNVILALRCGHPPPWLTRKCRLCNNLLW